MSIAIYDADCMPDRYLGYFKRCLHYFRLEKSTLPEAKDPSYSALFAGQDRLFVGYVWLTGLLPDGATIEMNEVLDAVALIG